MNTTKSMLFSVVIPVLNEINFLPRCLTALREQTLSREQFEVIFVDNGSTDGSLEFLQEQADLKCLHCEVQDPYIARNVGICAAEGKYLAFTDADCLVASNWLAEYAKTIERHDPGIIIGRLAFPYGSSSFVQYYENYYAAKMKVFAENRNRKSCFGHAGNMVVRSDLFMTLGLFSGMPIVGDGEVVQKFLEHYPEARFYYLDEAVAVHLEVTTAWQLLEKLYRYGLYTARYQQVSNFRAMPLSQKLRTFQKCRTASKAGPLQVFALGYSLVVQQLVYLAGVYAAKLRAFGRMPRHAASR